MCDRIKAVTVLHSYAKFQKGGVADKIRVCAGSYVGFPGGTVVKNPPANAGDSRDVGLIPGSGRCPGVGNGNPLQYSCLENHGQRGLLGSKLRVCYSPWGAKSRMQLSTIPQ